MGTFSIAKAVYISDSILVVGGSFGTYSGFNRKNLVLANKVTGTVSPWNPSPDNEVTVVTGNDSLIVVGGDLYQYQRCNAPETGRVQSK